MATDNAAEATPTAPEVPATAAVTAPPATPAAPPPSLVATRRVLWRPVPDNPAAKDGYVGMFCGQDAATMVTQLNELHGARRTYRSEPLTPFADTPVTPTPAPAG